MDRCGPVPPRSGSGGRRDRPTGLRSSTGGTETGCVGRFHTPARHRRHDLANPFAVNRSRRDIGDLVAGRRPPTTRAELPRPAIRTDQSPETHPSFFDTVCRILATPVSHRRGKREFEGASAWSPARAPRPSLPPSWSPVTGRRCPSTACAGSTDGGSVRVLATALSQVAAGSARPFGALLYHFGTRKLSFPEEPHHPHRRGVARRSPRRRLGVGRCGGTTMPGSLPAALGVLVESEHVGAPAI